MAVTCLSWTSHPRLTQIVLSRSDHLDPSLSEVIPLPLPLELVLVAPGAST